MASQREQRELSTPSKFSSPNPPAPMNNISTSILNHHGAGSQAFLNHLQMTWDLHRNMQTETDKLQNENKSLKQTTDTLQNKCVTLRTNEQTAVSELSKLRASNQSIKNEVTAMRKQLERVVGAATKQREANERAVMSLATAEKETQRVTIELTNTRSGLESSRSKMHALTHQLNTTVEDNERIKMQLETSQKQQRALRMTEEEMSEHLQRVVDRLQESEKSRNELKTQLKREKSQQTEYRKECDQLKESMERVRDVSTSSAKAIRTLKEELNQRDQTAVELIQDITELRKESEKREHLAKKAADRANSNHQKMEDECHEYSQQLISLQSENQNLIDALGISHNEMEMESAETASKFTMATQRISEMKHTIDIQCQQLNEMEESNIDASKRQYVSNQQLEKDGFKIKELTEALQETQRGAQALQEAAAAATKRLGRAIQERDVLVARQDELLNEQNERDQELELTLLKAAERIKKSEKIQKTLEKRLTQERNDNTLSKENQQNAEEALEEIMVQNTSNENQLNKNILDIQTDFTNAISERDEMIQKYQLLEEKTNEAERGECIAIKERDSTKVTLEATVSKLEQVTEELGRRIQSEMVLGEEMTNLREELQKNEIKNSDLNDEKGEEIEKLTNECTDLERALTTR